MNIKNKSTIEVFTNHYKSYIIDLCYNKIQWSWKFKLLRSNPDIFINDIDYDYSAVRWYYQGGTVAYIEVEDLENYATIVVMHNSEFCEEVVLNP